MTLAEQAITININPNTFIKLDDQSHKKKWSNHSYVDQVRFLRQRILDPMSNRFLNYSAAFEQTKAGHVHVHILYRPKSQHDNVDLDEIKQNFIRLLPRMNKELQQRLWFQETLYNIHGWQLYIDKDQNPDLAEQEEGGAMKSDAIISGADGDSEAMLTPDLEQYTEKQLSIKLF